MRTYIALLLSPILAACASGPSPVALTSRSEINGEVKQTVAIQVAGAPVQVAAIHATGKGVVTLSTTKPYITTEGDVVILPGATIPADAIRSTPPKWAAPASLPAGACEVPAAPLAAPAGASCATVSAKAAPADCRPVYRSPCGAVPTAPTAESWNRAGLTGYHPGQVPWSPAGPCPGVAAGAARPMPTAAKVALAPVGLIACLVKGLISAGECMIAGGGI